MKSFAEFLTESKKQYAFRIRLACECTTESLANLRIALNKYKLSAMGEPKTSPIAETHTGFEHIKNTQITVIDVLTDYPANPVQIRELARDAMKISEAYIMVLSPGEDANALPVVPVNADKALLDTHEMSAPDPKAHELVGLQRLESMLAELNKDKHEGIQYKGINDEIQVKQAHKEKRAKTTNDLPMGNTSPVGGRKMPSVR